jgi:hypothetical protein
MHGRFGRLCVNPFAITCHEHDGDPGHGELSPPDVVWEYAVIAGLIDLTCFVAMTGGKVHEKCAVTRRRDPSAIADESPRPVFVELQYWYVPASSYV